MTNKVCKVQIHGLVSRLRSDGRRVVCPPARYTMRELSVDRYELSSDDLPTFELTLKEVAHYMKTEMKVVEGHWP